MKHPPEAHSALTGSFVINLPSDRTLRVCSSIFQPNTGFHLEVFANLKQQASKLLDGGKYVTLIFEEPSVQDDLVFNSSKNQLTLSYHSLR